MWGRMKNEAQVTSLLSLGPTFITLTHHHPFALSGISSLSLGPSDPVSHSAKLLNNYHVPCAKGKRQNGFMDSSEWHQEKVGPILKI